MSWTGHSTDIALLSCDRSPEGSRRAAAQASVLILFVDISVVLVDTLSYQSVLSDMGI